MRCNDHDIGPVVKNCRRSFDFTFLFENTILSIGPSLLVFFAALGKICHLHYRPRVILARKFQILKLVGLQKQI